MKKFLLCLVFSASAAGYGCSSNDDAPENPAAKFYTVPSTLNFDAGKGELPLTVTTDARWTITCDAEWLSAVPAEGTGSARIAVTAEANALSHARTASVRIAYGGTEPTVIPVSQQVDRQQQVDMFSSTEEMKSYLEARVAAADYAESLTAADGVLRFGFKGAATRGVEKGSIPVFTVAGSGLWAADGVATAAPCDADALRAGAVPAVTVTARGTIALDGADTGVAAPSDGAVALRCVLDTGKFICFAFADGSLIPIGSELRGTFNPPLPVGRESLKILFIGNSFTVDATEHLPGMLRSAGITRIRMVRAYHGGYKLPEFFENYEAPDICTYYHCEAGETKWEYEGTLNRSLKSIVESDTWDIVTLQEHTGSYFAWEWDETERGAISGLCDYIQQAQPLDRPTIGYIMAQAYGTSHTHYPKYFPNQQAMFKAIVEQVQKITAQTCIDIVIPSGTSLQNLRTTSLNKDNGMDLTRDSYHMDYGISRYASAATVFRTLITPVTGIGVEGNTYRYSTASTSATGYSTPVTDANAPTAIRAAVEACRSPYAVTDMSKY